jgi:hypothetical protein
LLISFGIYAETRKAVFSDYSGMKLDRWAALIGSISGRVDFVRYKNHGGSPLFRRTMRNMGQSAEDIKELTEAFDSAVREYQHMN